MREGRRHVVLPLLIELRAGETDLREKDVVLQLGRPHKLEHARGQARVLKTPFSRVTVLSGCWGRRG